jgi:phosphate transport system ATP-binding protein
VPAGKGPTQQPARTKIESQGLSSWYGKKQALENIDLKIGEKSITALVGPSGCGKSTYLRCINRMNDLVRGFRAEGSITIGGHEVYCRDTDLPALRRNVGMVFQHPNPFPMSIYDNIALAVREHTPRVRKSDLDETVERSLRQANLFDEVKDQIHQSAFAISGGQQQRLCIARALAITPDVLMLDEPCASLDPVSTSRIEELLLELEKDYTIVIVTHNLAQARRISDYMAFFLMGKLVEHGPTWHMLENAQFPETRDYLAGAFG